MLTLPQEFATLALQPAEIEWKAAQGAGVVRILPYRRKEGAAAQTGLAGGNGAGYVIEQNAILAPAMFAAMDYDDLLHIQRLLNHPSARTTPATVDDGL